MMDDMAEAKRFAVVTDWVPAIAVWCGLTILSAFSVLAACWFGSVLLAYCIGALWGAGDQIRKHKAALLADPTSTGERGE